MKKWLISAGHAARGIALFILTERNARIELSIAAFVIVTGAWLGISIVEFCIILLCVGAVLATEAFNTAVERMADYQTKDQHPDIKDIKDLSAGAVLITAIISLCIGLLILGPKLLNAFGFI